MTERIIVTLLPILLGVNTPRSIDLMIGEKFNFMIPQCQIELQLLV